MGVCEKVVRLLDERHERVLTQEELAFIETHAAECLGCRESKLATDEAIRLLKAFSDDDFPLPDDFDRSLKKRLAAARDVKESSWFAQPFKRLEFAFFTAALLLALSLGIYFIAASPEHEEKPLLLAEKEVGAESPVSIDLEFLAVEAVPGISITISLDEGIKFLSKYEEIASQKSHVWMGDFKEGLNTVPFMVMVEKPGTWNITAKADINGQHHEHRIILKSDGTRIHIAHYTLSKTRNADVL